MLLSKIIMAITCPEMNMAHNGQIRPFMSAMSKTRQRKWRRDRNFTFTSPQRLCCYSSVNFLGLCLTISRRPVGWMTEFPALLSSLSSFTYLYVFTCGRASRMVWGWEWRKVAILPSCPSLACDWPGAWQSPRTCPGSPRGKGSLSSSGHGWSTAWQVSPSGRRK